MLIFAYMNTIYYFRPHWGVLLVKYKPKLGCLFIESNFVAMVLEGTFLFFILPPFQKDCPVSKYGHGLLHGSLIESRYNLTTLN